MPTRALRSEYVAPSIVSANVAPRFSFFAMADAISDASPSSARYWWLDGQALDGKLALGAPLPRVAPPLTG